MTRFSHTDLLRVTIGKRATRSAGSRKETRGRWIRPLRLRPLTTKLWAARNENFLAGEECP